MASFNIWLGAARPKTLPAAFAPVLLGSGLAYSIGAFDWRPAGICLLFGLLIQIGTNFANDYSDAANGADTEERIGPQRAVASGLIPAATMKRVAITVLAVAFCVGLALIPFGGWWLLLVGVASVACAWLYTGGPFPLGYNGLGDVFVILFFGFVAVGCTFYVQAGYVSKEALVLGLACGLLVNNILVVNNTRDVEQDEDAGKRTLVVIFGKKMAYLQYGEALVIAGLTVGWFVWRGHSPVMLSALLPILFGAVELIRLCTAKTAQDYGRLLLGASGIAAGYALLATLGLLP